MTDRAKRLAQPCASPNLGLVLADGQRWVIRALDAQAEATVLGLGKVMRLSVFQGGGKLCAVSGRKGARGVRGGARGRLFCRLGPARDMRTEVLRIERIATAIAVKSLARNGLLLHGALAVRDGVGFILAGSSGVGKSTASRRLPSPWRSLSDDCVLVVRDANGRYWAHPWPTWSLLRDNGLVESWPVEQAVPLKALLFLSQSPLDRAEPVAITPATALIMESAAHLARTVALTSGNDANRAICRKYLRAAWALAVTVPSYRLRISLTGSFWNEIEQAVPMEPQMNADGHRLGARTRRAADGRGTATKPRNTRSGYEPPRRPLAKGRKPRLVCFQTRRRTFLKLVVGRRVVGSVNDVLREWHIQRPFRSLIDRRSLESPPPHDWAHSASKSNQADGSFQW